MNQKKVREILKETAYPRFGGSEAEKKTAEYFVRQCEELGLSARLEGFPVPCYETRLATLSLKGKEFPCTAYFGTGEGEVEAPLYYLRDKDEFSLLGCRGCVVLSDFTVGQSLHEKLVKNGALALITHSHLPHYDRKDLAYREFRFEGEKLPALHVPTDTALKLVKNEGKPICVKVAQTVCEGTSYNVICDLEGEIDETVIVCAHYDSTANSLGSFDNTSSAIGLLYLAEYFMKTAHRRRIRLLWCGSEERGLLGSKAYVSAHGNEENPILNVNLDMLGVVMGSFRLFSCVNEEMEKHLTRFLDRHRVGGQVVYGIRSSDSNSFVYGGIPAVSFARYAPGGLFPIHSCYDTPDIVSPSRLLGDLRVVAKFTREMANYKKIPVSLEISSKIKEEVDQYMNRNKKKEEET